MKTNLVSFGVGVLFSIGLALSGMTTPAKVINFLDFFGTWDPSLAFVMVGAIAVHFVLFRFILRRPTPLLGGTFGIPTRRDIDARLVVGSALFGVGWGVGGFCPGPAVASFGGGALPVVVFVVSMIAGMLLFKQALELWEARGKKSEPQAAVEPEVSTRPAQST